MFYYFCSDLKRDNIININHHIWSTVSLEPKLCHSFVLKYLEVLKEEDVFNLT